jgi:hypothetical protein
VISTDARTIRVAHTQKSSNNCYNLGMDEILKKLTEQEGKIDAILRSVEKTRKYFMWTLIITVLTIVLPMIGLVFAIPALLRSMDFTGLGL